MSSEPSTSEPFSALRARLQALHPEPATPGPLYRCERCQDLGTRAYRSIGSDGSERIVADEPCDCELGIKIGRERRQTRINMLLGGAAIPPELSGITMANVVQPAEIVTKACEALGSGRNLLLHGVYGTGKTFLAVALLRSELERGRAGRFAVMSDLIDRIALCFKRDGPRVDSVLSAVQDIDLLVLDDLGTEADQDWILEKLYQIVNARWLQKRQTIITTNVGEDVLFERYTGRIMSRLLHRCTYLELEGPDRRLLGW